MANYFSKSLTLILYVIQNKNSHHSNSDNKYDIQIISGSLSNKIKIIVMLSFIFCFDIITSILISNFSSSITSFVLFDIILNISCIIIATLLSILILHYTYYKHHLFSIFIMVFGLFLFIITAYLTKYIYIYYEIIKLFVFKGGIFYYIFILVINILLKGLYEVFEKYLIDVKYMNPFAVNGLEGIIGLLVFIAIIVFIEFSPFTFRFIRGLHNYFEIISIFYMEYFFWYLLIIIASFVYHSFRILTIQHFYPTYTGLSDVFGSFFIWIWNCFFNKQYLAFLDHYGRKVDYERNIWNTLIELFCFIIIMLGILVYLEIIQLNFCGLGENTAHSISSRSESYYIKAINGINLAFAKDCEKEEIL